MNIIRLFRPVYSVKPIVKYARLNGLTDTTLPNVYRQILFTSVAAIHTSKCLCLKLNMPKQKHKKETLRYIKRREKNGHSMLPVPTGIHLQVIGSGGKGCPQSVLLTTTESRYLFNCGEGTQRISTEFKMRLSRVENIFITHRSWHNIGGLMGMCLTLEAAAVPKITIHGPPDVEKITSMVKGFAESQDFTLIKRELEEEFFDDGALRIDYVPFYSDKSIHHVDIMGSKYKPDSSESGSKRLRIEDKNISVAYIITPKAVKRSLLLDKCVEAGVPTGPLFKQLQNGESITLDNGMVVHPEQVLKPVVIQKPMIIVECASVDFLSCLLSTPQFKRFRENTEKKTEDMADIIIHMTPVEVMELPQYQDWMKSFGPETKHLVLNKSADDVCHTGLYRLQTMLNLLRPQIFPLLPHQTTKPTTVHNSKDNIHMAHTNLIYHYRPPKGFTRGQGPNLDMAEFEKEVKVKDNVVELLEELKERLNKIDHIHVEDQDFPEVVFLGTGASVPNKDRNVSCILVRLNKETNVLLDCGEASAYQLYRHYGSQTDDILRNIKGVFISHMHVDHHLGIFSVIQDRNDAFDKVDQEKPPLLVIAPGFMDKWIRFIDENVSPVYKDIKFIPSKKLLPHEVDISDANLKFVLKHLQLEDFLPIEVNHCNNAFGVRLQSNGFKLVYSGDTMPCTRLIASGIDCDLLIHEATMEDDLEEDAKFKTHSTTSQAIEVGVKMKAKFILLNHFSQRYSKIPRFNDRFTDRVGISFDNMRVRLCDLPLLPYFLPVLKAMFAEDYAELEFKTQKRNLKKQLIKEAIDSKQTIDDKRSASNPNISVVI